MVWIVCVFKNGFDTASLKRKKVFASALKRGKAENENAIIETVIHSELYLLVSRFVFRCKHLENFKPEIVERSFKVCPSRTLYILHARGTLSQPAGISVLVNVLASLSIASRETQQMDISNIVSQDK